MSKGLIFFLVITTLVTGYTLSHLIPPINKYFKNENYSWILDEETKA